MNVAEPSVPFSSTMNGDNLVEKGGGISEDVHRGMGENVDCEKHAVHLGVVIFLVGVVLYTVIRVRPSEVTPRIQARTTQIPIAKQRT